MENDNHGGTVVLAEATQSRNITAGQSSACLSGERIAPSNGRLG